MMNEISLADAAAWYVGHNIPVFPCAPRAKHPMTEHGFHDASADSAAIREIWKREPHANIGVPTGAPSGWLVLDIDPRNRGDVTFDGWLERYGRYPDTAESLTGGGGRHIVFRHAPGLRCGEIGPGVDAKTAGGYIICPPSIHPNGTPYRWDGLRGANNLLTLAEAPDWLLRLARERDKPEHTDPGDSVTK